ncbi:MAG: multicopper oxidase family protein [Burkholderiales bacterium]
MKRRSFLASGAALVGCALAASGCAGGPRRVLPPGRNIDLASVQRLEVTRIDPLLGRCAYVAHTANETASQPVLYARTGEFCDFIVENHLPQPTTIHFHGLTLPESADGAGFDPILPGGVKRVRFQVRNRAGLYWMHAHAHGFTAEQVHAGLVALLVIRDDEDAALVASLSLESSNEIALALADARVANGVIAPYAPSGDECLHGWFGNRMLSNGRGDASFQVAPGWVRLRLLNACNARGLLLAFRDASTSAMPPRAFYLLGTDGGLLAAPRSLERVFLYGAERVDIAIELKAGEKLDAVSLAFDPRHQVSGKWNRHRHPARENYPMLAATVLCEALGVSNTSLTDGVPMPLFTLNVSDTKRRAGGAALPEKLSTLADARQPGITSDRRIRMDLDSQHGFLIDNQTYQIDEAGFAAERGAKEIWEIRNSPISMPHAMHLHGFQFRVLRRQGTFGPARALATETNGRLPTDMGLKDTVTLWPNETLWLEVDFSLPSTKEFAGRQRYMFHCHNLEHEDGMMMRNISIS